MIGFKYSAATLALLLASGMAFAQDSTTTTTKPQTGAAIECPAAGTVAEADLTAECKAKASMTTTEVPKSDSGTSASGTTSTTGDTGTTTTDTGTAASSTTTTGDAETTTTMTPSTETMSNAMFASQFMGQTVYSAANESVGEINDLVLNKDLDTVTAIVGVGGFLGIGEKDVAIPIDQITATKDESNNLRLTIASSKEQLEAAPAFDRTVQN